MELQVIKNQIFEVRGCRIMTDFHLAALYQVETRVLKQAVRRNIDRFPEDFMFRLSKEEANSLINIGVSQFVISPNYNTGATDVFVFTEQGIAMLSSILKSKIAIQINIAIMRAFVKMREFSVSYAELQSQLEKFMLDTDMKFNDVYEALRFLTEQKQTDEKPRIPIGYKSYQ